MDENRLRNRLLLLWIVGCGVWAGGVEIYVGLTRPAPGFYQVAPVLIIPPIVAFIGGWLWLRFRRQS